jgi:hypothetical protein
MDDIRDTVYNRLHPSVPVPTGDTLYLDDCDPGYTRSGTWITGTYAPSLALSWWGDFEFCNTGGSIDKARWAPTIATSGTYSVSLFWVAGSNRCTNVTVRIQGNVTNYVTVSQQGSGADWNYIGDFYFAEGTSGYIEISDSTYSGGSVVIADGARLIRVSPLAIDEVVLPESIELSVYPNPFNSTCRITYPPHSEKLEIYDTKGRRIFSLDTEGYAGSFNYYPDMSIPSGVYLVVSSGKNTKEAKKIVFVR